MWLAFHLGLHCLSKYPFRGFLYTKGYYLVYGCLYGTGVLSNSYIMYRICSVCLQAWILKALELKQKTSLVAGEE